MKEIIIDTLRIGVEDAFRNGLDQCVKSEISRMIQSDDFVYVGIHKKSIDARRKSNVYYNIAAKVKIDKLFNVDSYKNIREEKPFSLSDLPTGDEKINSQIVIVGAGPCGLFAAYLLAQYGYKPVVIERGDQVEIRDKKVKDFWVNQVLDVDSNVQFGEGGAGAFSDGKLMTRVKDKRGKYVLQTFHSFGALDSILFESKPHIGTEKLQKIIISMRNDIIEKGGKFLFNTKLTDLTIENDAIKSITVNQNTTIDCDLLVLAIGHSARDTYEMLFNSGVSLIQKSFSMGVRIEHNREAIDYAQYGKAKKYIPESAEYFLNAKDNGRSAYTFCMCPGGVVVNAASEAGGVVTNGMSFSKRTGRNSNSAWVVNVNPEDFPDNHPLSGIKLQRKLEEKAFIAAGSNYHLPVMQLGDFMNDRITKNIGSIKPSVTSGYELSNVNDVLPEFIKGTLKKTAAKFDQKLNGFLQDDAIISGVETRTSSPVRIVRDEQMNTVNIKGIYPGGEGAGYAGGITSAGIDGLKIAEKIIAKYKAN